MSGLEPMFAAAALGAQVGSALLTMQGQQMQAEASASAQEYNSQVSAIQAQTEQDQAAAKAGEVARNTRQRLAAGRAGAMTSGLELTGSVSDLLTQAEDAGELDYLTAVYDGAAKATGLRNQTALSQSGACNARTAGGIGAATTALAGVADVYRTGSRTNFGGGGGSQLSNGQPVNLLAQRRL